MNFLKYTIPYLIFRVKTRRKIHTKQYKQPRKTLTQ